MAGQHLSSTHPPLLPTTEEDTVNRLRLLRSRRVGIATYRRLISEQGTAAKALEVLPEIARKAGISEYQPCPVGVVMAEIKAAHRIGATLLFDDDPAYPLQLRNISDAPPILWTLGTRRVLTRPLIAIVGARNASSLGIRMAKRLAEDLSTSGFTIVSGLARGVDAAAHLGALEGGTVAVQAGGVDVVYPAENAKLFDDIAEKGLRLSEMPISMQPQARHFPARNRIISGIAQAVVVVEAAGKSGSLITARNALDQSRDVFAVPGHPFDARAAGCNQLIRDGASLVRNANDVIEALQPAAQKPAELFKPSVQDHPRPVPAPSRDTSALHTEILSRLGPTPIAEDQLLRDISATATQASPLLLELELDGKITRQAGGLLSRVI